MSPVGLHGDQHTLAGDLELDIIIYLKTGELPSVCGAVRLMVDLGVIFGAVVCQLEGPAAQ